MQNNQLFASNPVKSIATVNLITVYNTHVYGYYRNNLLKDKLDMYCAILSLEGNAAIILRNGERIPLQEKGLFIGKLSDIRTLSSDCEHWHFLCYWFIPHNINLPVNKSFPLKKMDVQAENDEANKIIQLLQTHMERKIHYANSYFCCMLLNYLEELNPYTQKNTELTEKILLFINTHIEQELHVKDIADAFHYSEKHIRFLFNNTLGTSPKQYINRIKLENICHLLSTTNLSLQEIAERYSFASVSHLINSFKKEYGVTPTVYRQGK